MSDRIDTSHTRHAGIIRSLVVGTLLLFTGLALGLKLRAPDAGTDGGTPTKNVQPVAAEKPVTNIAISGTLFDQLKKTLHTQADADDAAPAEHAQPEPVLDENIPSPQPDPIIAARQQELQYLQEVLPDNRMIPHDKTPHQLDVMWDEFEHYHALQQRIDAGDATDAEKEQYYEIRVAKFEEEKALITLCREVAANSLASADEQQVLMCNHMTESSDERLQVIEDSITELERELLFSARDH